MLYGFAAIVFVGCLIGYYKTPSHDRLARLLFRFGMICGVLIAFLGWVMFNVVKIGGV